MPQIQDESGQSEPEAQVKPQRRPYEKPQILHELELETRAGSPVTIDPLDPDLFP